MEIPELAANPHSPHSSLTHTFLFIFLHFHLSISIQRRIPQPDGHIMLTHTTTTTTTTQKPEPTTKKTSLQPTQPELSIYPYPILWSPLFTPFGNGHIIRTVAFECTPSRSPHNKNLNSSLNHDRRRDKGDRGSRLRPWLGGRCGGGGGGNLPRDKRAAAAAARRCAVCWCAGATVLEQATCNIYLKRK